MQERITLYAPGVGHVAKVEGRLVSVDVEHGIVEFIPRRCQTVRRAYTTHSGGHVLVVRGWGHPDPPATGAWDARAVLDASQIIAELV